MNGKELVSKKLQAGPRSYFFPFHAEFSNRAVTEEGQIVDVTLYQNKDKYDGPDKPHPFELAFGRYKVPIGTFEPTVGEVQFRPHFVVNIRMTGDVIQEVDRDFDVTLWPVMSRQVNSDKFEDIDFSGFGLSATEKRRFGKMFRVDVDVELLRHNFRVRLEKERNEHNQGEK